MQLTEYHKKRNEQRLKANSEQPHVSQEEAVAQTLRMMKQSEDQLYHQVLDQGTFPGMTIVQSMVEIKRRVHGGSLRPDFKFMFYSEEDNGNPVIRSIIEDCCK